MISSWTLSSFKSVYDPTNLEMAPLTIFAGVNSSGKSTILQSILLVAQSLQSPVRQRPITLNGHLLRLGTYSDILSDNGSSKSIQVGFRLTSLDPSQGQIDSERHFSRYLYLRRGAEGTEAIECNVTFSARETAERKELVQLHPVLEDTYVGIEYRQENDEVTRSSIRMTRRDDNPTSFAKTLMLVEVRREDISALEFKPEVEPSSDLASELLTNFLSVGVSRQHFLPRLLLLRFDEVEEKAQTIVQAFLNRSNYVIQNKITKSDLDSLSDGFRRILIDSVVMASTMPTSQPWAVQHLKSSVETFKKHVTPQNLNVVFTWLDPSQKNHLIQLLGEATTQLDFICREGKGTIYKTKHQTLPRRVDFAVDYINNFFATNVKYLAPLRDEPKPVYPLSGISDPDDVGLHGENTAAVLELNKGREVSYVPSANLDVGLNRGTISRAPLERAVLDWLGYMGVVTKVETSDLGRLGHDLKVATSSQQILRDLTHVGVGVSQVLPIIVLCLIADPGATLIFEQPELHLHPRVQSRLADFFLSMAVLGKQCVVETHSEHLINKLRLRTAEAEKDNVSKFVKMYFVESVDGRSQYVPIAMNQYGALKVWPKGFFDEGEDLSADIVKAAMEKRAKEREEK